MLSSAVQSPAPSEEQLDRVFKALSDRTRRRLLRRLANGPARITELAEPFAMSLPAIGKHIRVLEQAGLLTRSVDGRVHHCALRASALKDADAWLKQYRAFWEENLDALSEYLTAEEGGNQNNSGDVP